MCHLKGLPPNELFERVQILTDAERTAVRALLCKLVDNEAVAPEERVIDHESQQTGMDGLF